MPRKRKRPVGGSRQMGPTLSDPTRHAPTRTTRSRPLHKMTKTTKRKKRKK